MNPVAVVELLVLPAFMVDPKEQFEGFFSHCKNRSKLNEVNSSGCFVANPICFS